MYGHFFPYHCGCSNLLEAIENQRASHEAKLIKMQEDMETMLARKVAETEQKMLDYEDQVP